MSLLDQEPLQAPLEQVVNHYDFDSAFEIKQYPYRPGVNTRVRYWTETRKKYGQRYVYQTLDPYTMKWLQEKPSLYTDIVVLLKVTDTNHSMCGHIVPIMRSLAGMPDKDLFELCLAYSFTLFQRDRIMEELNRRGYGKAPPWKEFPIINMKAAWDAENPLPAELRVQRLTNDEGILIETHGQAHYRLRKERQAKKAELKEMTEREMGDHAAIARMELAQAAKPKNNDPDSVDNMTPEELALYNELMNPTDEGS